MSETKLIFYGKISRQSDRLLILIPKPVRPLAEKLHGKRVKVIVEAVEDA